MARQRRQYRQWEGQAASGGAAGTRWAGGNTQAKGGAAAGGKAGAAGGKGGATHGGKGGAAAGGKGGAAGGKGGAGGAGPGQSDWQCPQCNFADRWWRKECYGCWKRTTALPHAAAGVAMAIAYDQVVQDLVARDPDTAKLVANLAKDAAAVATTDSTQPMSMQLDRAAERVEHKQSVVDKATEKEAKTRADFEKARLAVETAARFTLEAKSGLEEWQDKLFKLKQAAPATLGCLGLKALVPSFSDEDANTPEGQRLEEQAINFQRSIEAFQVKRRTGDKAAADAAEKGIAAAASGLEAGASAAADEYARMDGISNEGDQDKDIEDIIQLGLDQDKQRERLTAWKRSLEQARRRGPPGGRGDKSYASVVSAPAATAPERGERERSPRRKSDTEEDKGTQDDKEKGTQGDKQTQGK